ncbi:zinc finger protein 112 [Caerostris extrusa]|uniref:Zinc finger protein 112 n=1 Tax=Caerostris extrusa TaxID=172846 RepID=A0AAV4PLE2_CAEEX|nr:zinc finger protein 112 [Caerostris extrusa]
MHIKQAEINDALIQNFGSYLKLMKDKFHECDICSLLFTRRDRLVKHKSTHVIKNYICKVCESSFSNKTEFKTHQANHIDIEYQDIGDDIDKIESADMLPIDLSVKNKNQRKTYECDKCLNVYVRSSALQYHYLTHTKEKNRINVQYAKMLWTKNGLKRHILTHSGKKTFVCKLCDKVLCLGIFSSQTQQNSFF